MFEKSGCVLVISESEPFFEDLNGVCIAELDAKEAMVLKSEGQNTSLWESHASDRRVSGCRIMAEKVPRLPGPFGANGMMDFVSDDVTLCRRQGRDGTLFPGGTQPATLNE